ncbi:MAG: helix-turn-helix domain-containing protein [Mobilitalea sp.]
MTNNLGENIKRLRKEMKMTQSDLAGSEMTKSMLSQIENNLAMPSMKNLQYLSAKMGKPVSYFLGDTMNQSGLPVEEISIQIKEVVALISNIKLQEALLKLDEIVKKYNFDRDSKLYADLLSKYGECLLGLKNHEAGKEKIIEAVTIYKNKYLYIDAAKTYLILEEIPWNNFDYEQCTEILEEALQIYDNSINKDYAFEIETLYNRAVLYVGMDKMEESIVTCKNALEISKNTKIYYRSDELYKILASSNLFLEQYDHFEEDLRKAREFAVFTDNIIIMSNIDAILGLYNNKIGKPEEAIEYLQKAMGISEITDPFVYTEMAKSYYMLKKYQQALDLIKLIQFPEYTPFKYDYLHIWSSKIYEGMCLSKLDRQRDAIIAVKQGIEKIEFLGETKALAHANKTLSEIYSELRDYETAFSTLKRANKIEEAAKVNGLYY